MAHEFVILNTSGVTTTYTSYETIPVDSTLKNVIKFVPDLGTLVDANEILIEDTPATGFYNKIIPEDWTTSSENHLVLETSADSVVSNHYHPPTQDHHVAGDGHTDEEHREIALWNHKLQLLMIQERENASSN